MLTEIIVYAFFAAIAWRVGNGLVDIVVAGSVATMVCAVKFLTGCFNKKKDEL